jgi:hypothetical protein
VCAVAFTLAFSNGTANQPVHGPRPEPSGPFILTLSFVMPDRMRASQACSASLCDE